MKVKVTFPFKGEEGSESSGNGSGLGSLENRDDSGGTGKSNHQVAIIITVIVIIITVIKMMIAMKVGMSSLPAISKHVLDKLILEPIGPASGIVTLTLLILPYVLSES